MPQSRLGSFIESNVNTFIGFIGSMLLWQYVINPLWGFNTHIGDSFIITVIFTVWSILRGYFVRRYFVRRANEQLADALSHRAHGQSRGR
jgi:hypothetical protein